MEKNKDFYVIIMAGGIGTRFRPVSKKSFPKHCMDSQGTGKSLIRQTFDRFNQFIDEKNIYIVTNEEYTDLVLEHIPKITREQILEEPLGKNTAPCIAFATYYLLQKNPNATCIISPSDHLITDEIEFARTCLKALEFANSNDALVTLGITPFRPDTGYGYIQYNPKSLENGIHAVKTFTEKPTEEIAKNFIDSGEFLWNAGIFAWSLKTISNRFETNLIEIHQLFAEIDFKIPFKIAIAEAYGMCPSISIDYGIMEKEKNVFVIPSSFGWSDLGTWKSLWDVAQKDELNNAAIGEKIYFYNSKDNLVFSNNSKLLTVSGLDNIVVIDSDEVLLIMNMNSEQELKQIVSDVKEKFKGKYN